MFLQIHTLTSYHASLLNRDDAGLAKRIPFGGADRLRVSSQCLKRHWREWLIAQLENDPHLARGFRSRHFFDRIVKQRLIRQGLPEEQAHALTFQLAKGLLTAAGEKEALDKNTLEMKQPVLFGQAEADYFVEILQQAARAQEPEKWLEEKLKDKEFKGNLKALMAQAGLGRPAYGIEGALFGRFVTSDILARADAPVHVAHAFTTHALDTEMDFFTVVDDLAREEETGGAHMNETELGAGIFYGYVAVDVPLLVANLTGCQAKDWKSQDTSDAQKLLKLLLHAIAQVTPGAKLGSTAPYARAEWVLLEAGHELPTSLANAFLQPIKLSPTAHPMRQSVEAAAAYLDRLESMYGPGQNQRFVASCHPWPRPEASLPFPQAVEKALGAVFGG
jgi:CRISPR system Cascade subunit CasC